MEKAGLAIGVLGGIGLGLLLGSEYSGTYTTLLGAGLVIISIISLGVISYREKKQKV